MFFTGASFASEKIEDCSEIVDGVYVQKECITTETILEKYPIKNVPEELLPNLKSEQLDESIETGNPVVFL
ncbi:MAG: hypothetical protein UZ19_OD1000863 [Parcubacteria bacterium OLB19]|nr:MAG: hypothetical protein UZ19_OD1000863 [Parcubacteria bacterium OLB19]